MTARGETHTSEKDSASDRRDQRIAELEAEVEQTKAENATLKERIAQLKERIAQLEQRVAELERAGNCAEGANQRYALRRAQRSLRQATPFARDEHKADPKRPGRKAGQGLFLYRTPPTSDEVDETKPAWRCGDGHKRA